MQLEFFGAAGEVTGSCHILSVGDKRILLDCGLIQGGKKAARRNRDPFPFDAHKIDAVILSHAHIDHSGRLPLLVKRGFDGSIWTQNASADLCEILLKDSARLGEQDVDRRNRKRKRQGKKLLEPLYTSADADRTLKKIRGIPYRKPQEILPGVRATYYDAGHILGSGCVKVEIDENGQTRTLLFSGDLGQYDTPILRDPEPISHADYVLMESTYGGRLHRDRDQTISELGEIIQTARQSGGNIIIPAFAVGRSQELLYLFGKYYQQWDMGHWKIFLDSPMAIEASKIYWDYPHLYDEEATKLRKGVKEMPPLPNLQFCKSPQESRNINKLKGGAIIIAGSGMCTGGRILHHLKHNVWRGRNHVLIVGYQAQGSLGRRLVERKPYIRIHGENIKVAAQVHTVGGLSAHGDENDMARWYSSFKNTPPVYLVHGEKRSAREFQKKLSTDFGSEVTLTDPGMKLDLISGKIIDPGVPL
ncbi:MAG: MBL fold metallo-hydrolase [Gammaproteobacteria bacterium]|nr:MBL fold metallo-hydrolase [Gammaproteobacteria bacterium]